MTAFHLVPTATFDHEFARLSHEAQLLELYWRCCPAAASEGLFRSPIGYVVEDLGMDRGDVEKAITELTGARPFAYDWDSGIVLNKTALRDNPIRNGVRRTTGEIVPDNRQKGAISKLKSLPKTPLLNEFFRLAEEHSPDFADALREAMPELDLPPSQAPSKPLGGPSQSPSEGPSREEKRRVEEELIRDAADEPADMDAIRLWKAKLERAKETGDDFEVGFIKDELRKLGVSA